MLSKKEIFSLKGQALKEIEAVGDLDALQRIEKQYLGKTGLLTRILRSLKGLPEEARRDSGRVANEAKKVIEEALRDKQLQLRQRSRINFDLTEPGKQISVGHIHPLTQVRLEIEEFFLGQGFSVRTGPEIETDYYNFEALNIPKDHPARDMWDTFYLEFPVVAEKNKLLLRAHTSPMQIRVMEREKPPLAVIVPGRTFRREATDARHEHTFDQVEGFYVSEDANAAHLKYLLHALFRHLFGSDVEIKLRPGYFPFTEPSFELVMSCPFCHPSGDLPQGDKEKGCAVCGQGWLEMLGAGMIHPKVFEAVGYAPGKWRGFAFGLGMSRIAMLKFDLPDIRMFYQNDLRILKQF